jgi:hypothetical protein
MRVERFERLRREHATFVADINRQIAIRLSKRRDLLQQMAMLVRWDMWPLKLHRRGFFMLGEECSTTPEARAKAERLLREAFSALASSYLVSASPSDAAVAALTGTSVPDQVEKIQAECAIRDLVAVLGDVAEEKEVDVELSSALLNIGLMCGEPELSQEARDELLRLRSGAGEGED